MDRFCLAGVMGFPVLHSRSPKIHNYWMAQHGLQGAYVPLAIQADGLRAALRALPALGFAGCNLTIPHKEAAFAIVDEVSMLARRIGAINCVVARPDGSLFGENYDGWGYIESIREAAPSWRADAGPILVCGAGGGSRAVIAGLIEAGAREIRVINRTFERAKQFEHDFGSVVQAIEWSKRSEAAAGAAMVVNTTSQGMTGYPSLDLSLDALPISALVSDIVYIPRETPLLRAARLRGNPTVNGLGMLLNQARPAFRDWFGILPDVTPELRTMIEATL